MPYMQRITWSGIPASHGCIRLTNDFAIRLWHLTKRGARVVIARPEVVPVEVTNPHLFVSKPKTAFDSSESLAIAVASNSNKTAVTTQAALISNCPIKERKVPKQQIIRTAPSATPSSDKANAALNRIEIPHDAIQQISELLVLTRISSC